jgi:chorismate synthase
MGAYAAFTVKVRNYQGIVTNVGAGVDVAVREEGEVADAAESPLTTDSNGDIAGGTLAGIAAGTRVHFRVEDYEGGAASATQILT